MRLVNETTDAVKTASPVMRTFDRAIGILGNAGCNEVVLRMFMDVADRLVPFVGAGLSATFGFPQWKEFLQHAADRLDVRGPVDELLEESRFEEAAEVLTRRQPQAFDDILEDAFHSRRLQQPLGKGAVRLVPAISRGPVLTTNFDRVLEAAFRDAHRQFDEVFPGSRIREASRALELRQRVLLKLHGDYFFPTNRVLTLDEYRREYGFSKSSADLSLPLPTVLRQAFGAGPLLFLGCSLQSDRTTSVISQVAATLPGTVHFALLSESENTPERLRQLEGWNIRALFFPAGQYGKIEEFLQCIAEALATDRSELVPATIERAPAVVWDSRVVEVRSRLLNRVRRDWIEGVLHQSLYQIARVDTQLEIEPSKTEHPQKMTIQEMGYGHKRLATGTSLASVFELSDKALLILGAPGTGKTTLLLELASDLLKRTDPATDSPIPIILNLSSWSRRREPLLTWLVTELNEMYDLPSQMAERFAENEQLSLLLDGLDEVSTECRDACVDAINDFRREHGFVQLAVCSRTEEYDALSRKLRLPFAVLIEELTKEAVDEYLAGRGKGFEVLRRATRTDAELSSFLRTPLLISIAALTLEGDGRRPETAGLQGIPNLFESYCEQMFKRRGVQMRYSRTKTLCSLRLLATNMSRWNTTIFRMEDMTPEWFVSPQLKWLSIVLPRLVPGFLIPPVALMMGWGVKMAGLACLCWAIPAVAIGGQDLREHGLAEWWGRALLVALISASLGGLAFGWVGFIVLGALAVIVEWRRGGLGIGLVVGVLLALWWVVARSSVGVYQEHELELWATLVFLCVPALLFVLTPKRNFSYSLAVGLTSCALLTGLQNPSRSDLFWMVGMPSLWFGLSAWMAGFNSPVRVVEKLRFSVHNILSAKRRGLMLSLLLCVGIALCLTFLIGLGVAGGSMGYSTLGPQSLWIALGAGVMLGILRVGVAPGNISSAGMPNAGTLRSGAHALVIFVSILICSGGIGFALEWETADRWTGAWLGFLLGMPLGLRFGGLFWFRHYVVRALAAAAQHGPWKYRRFLDHAVDRLFLRRVGNGYLFVHRLLLEHLARTYPLTDNAPPTEPQMVK